MRGRLLAPGAEDDAVGREGAEPPTTAIGTTVSEGECLNMVRCHRGVENDHHNTLDTAFAEADRPWTTSSPQGMLAVLRRQRIAYTMLTLFRAVTLRLEKSRALPWKRLLGWVQLALVAAGPEHIAGLRSRENTAATS